MTTTALAQAATEYTTIESTPASDSTRAPAAPRQAVAAPGIPGLAGCTGAGAGRTEVSGHGQFPTPLDAPHRAPRWRSTVGAGGTCTIASGTQISYANFDHGASTPALRSVHEAVEAAAQTYSSVHRGQGYNSQVSSAYYERAREEVARFVGARSDDHVVFTRQTTDSMNLLARILPTGTQVIVFAAEHHASLLPWDAVTRLAIPRTIADACGALTAALRTLDQTHPAAGRLVILGGASNVTGEFWPVAKLAAIAREYGARVAIDAAQLAPHAALDLADLDADYLAFSGHKLYAPYGAGVLVGRSDWFDAAPPYLAGGGASAEVTAAHTQWAVGPARHEGGSPNVLGAVALAAACAHVTRYREQIEAHENALGARLRAGLAEIAGVRSYDIFAGEVQRAPVATFTVTGLEPGVVSAALSHEYGIGVRDGKFCAHPLVDHLLRAQAPSTAVRVSIGLGNSEEQLERLLVAIAELATRGPAANYVRDEAGRWSVAGAAEVNPAPLW